MSGKMRRQRATRLLVGGGSLASLVVALGLTTGCLGDDSNTAPADAGTASDGTVASTDGASDARAADAGDAGPGPCTPYDGGPPDDAAVKQGIALVVQSKCQTCHGTALSGNQDGVPDPLTGGTSYPPNLTPEPTTGIGCWTNAQIEDAILDGMDNQGGTLCPPMPLFGDAGMDRASAAAIVAFLRTLTPVVNHVPDTSCDVIPDAGSDARADAGSDAGADAATAPDGSTADAGTDGGGDAGADAGEGDGGGDATTQADASSDDAGADVTTIPIPDAGADGA